MQLANSAYFTIAARWSALRAQSERGLTTTEVAVLTFILVGIAIVIGGLLLGVGGEAVDNIDSSPSVTGGGLTTTDGSGGSSVPSGG